MQAWSETYRPGVDSPVLPHTAEIFLDGKKMEDAVFADDEAGVVITLERAQLVFKDGHTVDRPNFEAPVGEGQYAYREYRGVVEIKGKRLYTPTPGAPFAVNPRHLQLIRLMYVEDYQHPFPPYIDQKRPLGSSGDWEEDAMKQMGWRPAVDDYYTEEQRETVRQLFKDSSTVLQIVLVTGEFRPGWFRKTCQYSARSWVRLTDEEVLGMGLDVMATVLIGNDNGLPVKRNG
jgi:hypothetical protein